MIGFLKVLRLIGEKYLSKAYTLKIPLPKEGIKSIILNLQKKHFVKRILRYLYTPPPLKFLYYGENGNNIYILLSNDK